MHEYSDELWYRYVCPMCANNHVVCVCADGWSSTDDVVVMTEEGLIQSRIRQEHQDHPDVYSQLDAEYHEIAVSHRNDWISDKLYPLIVSIYPLNANQFITLFLEFNVQDKIKLLVDHEYLVEKCVRAMDILQQRRDEVKNCVYKIFE